MAPETSRILRIWRRRKASGAGIQVNPMFMIKNSANETDQLFKPLSFR
jgi:hypothetical protein